jgi:hypothetical protein
VVVVDGGVVDGVGDDDRVGVVSGVVVDGPPPPPRESWMRP